MREPCEIGLLNLVRLQVTAFRDSLSKLGDIFVNDAFGTAHRAHSSMVGMKGKMPCVAGDLVLPSPLHAYLSSRSLPTRMSFDDSASGVGTVRCRPRISP